MTLVADPPETNAAPTSMSTSNRSSASAWRLASRLARRETRRRPGRTALVGILIAIPVAAMTLGSVIVRTQAEGRQWPNQFALRYGTGDVAVDANILTTTFERQPDFTLPAGSRAIDYLWVSTYLRPADPGVVAPYVVLSDMPLADPMVSSAVDILDGSAPRTGEVLLGPAVAKTLGVGVGDELMLDRPAGTWTVSGIGRYRDDYWADLFVVPGFDRSRIVPELQQLVRVYDLPADVTPDQARALATGVGGLTRFDDPFAGSDFQASPVLAWGWVAGVLSLLAVGIVVAAAFATSARRQLVTVGQLASNGATDRVIRRSLALQGTWTAMVGAIIGTGLGLAALPFVRGTVTRVLQHDLPAYVVSGRDLAIIAVTATIAGTIAAAVPARSAARVPVMSALAGRRPLGAPPKWLVPTGIALFLAGLGLLGVAGTGARNDSSNSTIWPLLAVIAVVAVVFGMICATPLVVARIGRLGRSSPLSWRFALRSLARSRTRSAAVVAAIAVTVGGAVAGSAIVENAFVGRYGWELPPMPDDAFVVVQYADPTCCGDVIDAGPLPAVDVPDDIAANIDAVFPGAESAPYLVAAYDPPAFDSNSPDAEYPDPQGPLVATPAMLDLLGLAAVDVATLETEGQLWARQPSSFEVGSVDVAGIAPTINYPTEGGDISLTPPVSEHVPEYTFSFSRPIVTPDYARQLGFELVQRGIIVRTGRALTADQRQALSTSFGAAALADDAFVEPGDLPIVVSDGQASEPYWGFGYDDPNWRRGGSDLLRARLAVLAAALLLTSLVVAIGLSLAAAEGRIERETLAVVGARPASLRRQAAARASVLAVVGIALGLPTGYAPAWVLFRTTSAGGFYEPLRFPWVVAISIAVIIPVAVAAIAWAGSGVAQRVRPASPTRRD
jgi:putative ABC transport system permease protein